jgi:hypothetical protein
VKYFLRYLILAAVTGMMVVACDSSDDDKKRSIGEAYFPLKTGSYQVYDVNEIIYTLGVPETLQYQLKVAIVDKFLNTEGDSTFVIHRSKRNTDIDPWVYTTTWSVRNSNLEIVQNEENISYIKLKFPVNAGATWNGNAYNTLEEDEYILESVNTTEAFNDQSFTDCLTVNQSDNDDYIVFLDQRKEVYAKDIGLVHKTTTQLSFCTKDNCLGQQQVESGTIYQQTIRAYGVE